jgi:AcrR family transcriptional regulator
MPTRTLSRPDRTQRERSETTIRALVDAARSLFARDGYEAASLDEVARLAGVTKGALYHHFGGKRELFLAVFEAEERRLMRTIAEAHGKERDPWKGFYAGCRAFLEALDPGVQQITLIDAPAVLGTEAVAEILDRYSMKLTRNGLALAIQAGAIRPRPIEPLAVLLNGALCEGARLVSRADDTASARRAVLREIRALLDGLRP